MAISSEGCYKFATTLKLADFGLVRSYRDKNSLTEYVSTRWYRSPELVLHSPQYNEKVDVFALGCNMAELIIGRPLFPGKTELDQLQTIISVMGAPKQSDWPEGYNLANKLKLSIPQNHGVYESGRLK